VVAVTPAYKGVELAWTLGVRSDNGAARSVDLDGLGANRAIVLSGTATGRIWLLDFHARSKPLVLPADQCAKPWMHGSTRVECLWVARGVPARTVRVATTGAVLSADGARTRVASPTLGTN
jgi:hypothetical protein